MFQLTQTNKPQAFGAIATLALIGLLALTGCSSDDPGVGSVSGEQSPDAAHQTYSAAEFFETTG